MLHYLVWPGALLACLGGLGVIWGAVSVWRGRKQGAAEAELREILRRALLLNLTSFFLAIIGLMMVVIGLLLG